ncbi:MULTISPECIES: iron uptake porin [Synechocystis]|uniref:Iron uptake porin n=1 Tax=Synechocystis salina LEGE 00031 TaxID=1828736 RepID=A0ABR9VPX7_9SYNC|nr:MULTISPECIES: iron uptake porin [Synechocystis]MBD2654512.1 iron uptake porin [Synechocystis sp. FACHB-383]MBE9239537.1 iron uptake porin [Synechocystis salina LEGE 00041]MBE9252291.1 iron uptake porin [Synechocystis salina LEGE 00031]
MLKLSWKSLLVSPAVIGAALVAGAANAAPDNVTNAQVLDQLDQYTAEGQLSSVDQVTSVSELRDVQPTAWAYEALKSLVERYGCIVGYPDRTFRGDRALSRWEFAAGLNACMNVMERLIQENVAVLREDIDKLKRLMQEFEAELAALGARVDNLEARTSFLEDHQFSTTTKLTGEVIFAPTAIFGTKNTLNNQSDNNQAVFQNRVRLQFNTSFSGEDLLVTRLAAGSNNRFKSFYPTQNVIDPETGNPIGIVGNYYESPTFTQVHQLSPGDNNNVAVDWLAYYVPLDLGTNFRLNNYIAAFGGIWDDFVPTLNPYFDDYTGGKGSLSQFTAQNPIYSIGGGTGIGTSLELGFLSNLLGPTSLSLGYLASTGANPSSGSSVTNPATGNNYDFSSGGNGLFNGGYGALAQITTNIFDRVSLGFTYVNAYTTPDAAIFGKGGTQGIVGTTAANLNRSELNDSFVNGLGVGAPPVDAATYNGNVSGGTASGNVVNPYDFGGKQTNSYGIQMAWNVADWLSFSAYGSYTNVTLIGKDNGDIWTYGGGFAFPDLGKEGNVLGIFAGVQPYVSGFTNGTLGTTFVTTANPVQVELFYKYQLTDNLSLTPGVIWISKPEQTTNATDAFIGTIRGTFTF